MERSIRKVSEWKGLVGTSACADFMMFFDATARPSRLRRRDGAEMNSRVQFPIFIRISEILVIERTQKRKKTLHNGIISPNVDTLFSQLIFSEYC